MTHFKLLPLLLFVQTISYADYTVIYPLADSSISIKHKIEPSLPTYTEWASVGEPYNCTYSTPKEDTIEEDTVYTKTFSNCTQKQSRTKTLDSNVTTEERTISGVQYQAQSIGTKLAVATYTEWAISGKPYDCKSASPMEDAFTEGTVFTKHYTDCSQNLTRIKTYKGVQTTESKVATGYGYDAESVGTRSVTECMTRSTDYYWIDAAKQPLGSPNYKYNIKWNKSTLASYTSKVNNNPADTSFTSDGYIYSRGTYRSTTLRFEDYKYFYYDICRKPI